jgi:hypothetical protein
MGIPPLNTQKLSILNLHSVLLCYMYEVYGNYHTKAVQNSTL